MLVEFEKWHGCRNDFVVIKVDENENYTFDSLHRQAKAICNRDGSGIGADGIICLHMPRGQHVFPSKLSIINSDGSLAQTCGNGIRCAAGSILRAANTEHVAIPEDLHLNLASGEVSVRTLGKLPNHLMPLFAVEMGMPTVNERNAWHDAAVEAVEKIVQEHKLKIRISDIGTCEILNQHIVVFCDRLRREDLLILGPAIQQSQDWDGINLHLVADATLDDVEKSQGSAALSGSLEERYDVLVWERGAGETAACGSGACAIGACILTSGLNSREDWLLIRMPGGPLYVRQTEEGEQVTLAGPVQHSFDGKLEV
jgi:diaminopimelate epimerase